MTDDQGERLIGVEDMLESRPGDDGCDEMAMLTIQLVEHLRQSCEPILASGLGVYDGPLITALVVYAGTLHGTMTGIGAVPDLTDEARDKMLGVNFMTGVGMGLRRVQQAKANLERERTGQGPVVS